MHKSLIIFALVGLGVACGSADPDDENNDPAGDGGNAGTGGTTGVGGSLPGSTGGSSAGTGGAPKMLEVGEVRYAHCTDANGKLGLKRQENVAGTTEEGECQEAFVSVWETSAYPFAPDTIELPLVANGSYNFIVEWGDGTFDEITDAAAAESKHKYTAAGRYEVRIVGEFVGWQLAKDGANDALRFDIEDIASRGLPLQSAQLNPAIALHEISQWGDMVLGATSGQFYRATNLQITATDAPDLSQTSSLELAFGACASLTGGVGDWDTSSITNLASTFRVTSNFNGELNDWDVSSVTDMNHLFSAATKFSQPLDKWNVSSVTDMSGIFDNASVFNQPLDSWDVGAVTTLSGAFRGAKTFNQPLNSWDVSLVTNISNLFLGADVFDQPLGDWDVTSVRSAGFVFTLSGLTTDNYGEILIGWAKLDVRRGVTFRAQGVTYPASAAASRAVLESKGWRIADDGQAP